MERFHYYLGEIGPVKGAALSAWEAVEADLRAEGFCRFDSFQSFRSNIKHYKRGAGCECIRLTTIY